MGILPRQMDIDLGGVERAVSQPALELVGTDPLAGLLSREGVAQIMQRGLLGDPSQAAIRTILWCPCRL